MSCKYNNCKICGYKSECEIYKENAELKQAKKGKVVEHFEAYGQCRDSRRIAELEQKLEQTEKDLADYQFNYPNIKELEKENAELRIFKEKCKFNVSDICKDIETENQLTKAKEFLREIIDTPVFNQMGGELYENEGYTELVAEAEQFLKESEVEK